VGVVAAQKDDSLGYFSSSSDSHEIITESLPDNKDEEGKSKC